MAASERPLGIPTVRDRVVQTAAKLVLEPIFEADLDPAAHGYRPGRSGADAIKAVILSRGHAVEALAWTGRVMAKLRLVLNETKTAIRDARRERFDFLGYGFGPHHYRKDGHWYLGASPSNKNVLRLKAKVSDILVPSNMGTWPDVRDRLNRAGRILTAAMTSEARATRLGATEPTIRLIQTGTSDVWQPLLATRAAMALGVSPGGGE